MPQYRPPVQSSASWYTFLRELARWLASSLWTYLTPKSSTTRENVMGLLYCGITLKWNLKKRDRWLELSMPGYIEKQLSKYKHPTPKRPQHAPYPCAPKTYVKSVQDPIATDNSPPAGQEGIIHVQKLVGSILYYARSVDSTPLVAMNILASEQAYST